MNYPGFQNPVGRFSGSDGTINCRIASTFRVIA